MYDVYKQKYLQSKRYRNTDISEEICKIKTRRPFDLCKIIQTYFNTPCKEVVLLKKMRSPNCETLSIGYSSATT